MYNSIYQNKDINITTNNITTRIFNNTNSIFITITSQYDNFSLLDNEIAFLLAVCDSLNKNNIPANLNITRLSDGTLDVRYGLWQIGRIRLQKRKHSMQILYNNDDVKWFDGQLDDFFEAIPEWILYLKNIIESHKRFLL